MSAYGTVAPVALYLPQLSRGGAEWALLRLGSALSARGIGAGFILDRDDGPLRKTAADAGLPVETLAARRTLEAIPRLALWLRRRRPRVLLSAISHNNVAAALAGRLAGRVTRVILSEHTVLSAHSADAGNWQHRLMPRLAGWAYPLADAVTAVTGAVADDLARCAGLDRSRIAVLPNPVVTADTRHRAAGPSPHPWLDDGGPPVLVAAGRLVPLKGFDLLLRAVAVLAARRSLRLLILGEGPERGRLECLAAELGLAGDVVALPGAVEDVLPAFARAAAVICSSRFEGFGMVLVEAMACGTPVVSTDCPGGPREIMGDGCFGPLCPVEDVPALVQAMEHVLRAPLPPDTLRARAADYSDDAAVAATLALFRRLGVDLP